MWEYAPLNWTPEPPKERGWYWAVSDKSDTPTIYYFYESNGYWWCSYNGYEGKTADKTFELFMGPLPVPEIPDGLD